MMVAELRTRTKGSAGGGPTRRDDNPVGTASLTAQSADKSQSAGSIPAQSGLEYREPGGDTCPTKSKDAPRLR